MVDDFFGGRVAPAAPTRASRHDAAPRESCLSTPPLYSEKDYDATVLPTYTDVLKYEQNGEKEAEPFSLSEWFFKHGFCTSHLSPPI